MCVLLCVTQEKAKQLHRWIKKCPVSRFLFQGWQYFCTFPIILFLKGKQSKTTLQTPPFLHSTPDELNYGDFETGTPYTITSTDICWSGFEGIFMWNLLHTSENLPIEGVYEDRKRPKTFVWKCKNTVNMFFFLYFWRAAVYWSLLCLCVAHFVFLRDV